MRVGWFPENYVKLLDGSEVAKLEEELVQEQLDQASECVACSLCGRGGAPGVKEMACLICLISLFFLLRRRLLLQRQARAQALGDHQGAA